MKVRSGADGACALRACVCADSARPRQAAGLGTCVQRLCVAATTEQENETDAARKKRAQAVRIALVFWRKNSAQLAENDSAARSGWRATATRRSSSVRKLTQCAFAERRKQLSAKILRTYPDRVPVIVNGRGVALSKQKMLTPIDMTVGTFIQEVKKHIVADDGDARSLESIFLFVNNSVMPNVSALMSVVYEANKDDDGFLYVTVTKENVFGFA